ncbi:MAG: DUF4007 family protein [Deltaproteobacteria bacterium]|nr:DUF4007 family protein [Deltaproteobacteria bacterium]
MYRFSGHETFPCRYAWLPKAVQTVSENPDILTPAKEDDAMVKLGVGKNMVRSIRFWAEAADIIANTKAGHALTDFGRDLLWEDKGLDPYLEDIQTLWLIHWKLATNQRALIFAWDYLLNQFHEPELYASSVVRVLSKAATRVSEKEISRGSLEQLYGVFLHSYVPTRGRKGEVKEDNLDCPLVELELLRHIGFTDSALNPGRLEPKYAFRREDKPEIGQALFAFCLEEFWKNRFGSKEQSIPFHSIVYGHGSPGQVFKIPEADVRTRLFAIEKQTDGFFNFEESAAIPRVVRHEEKKPPSLATIYEVAADA